MMNTNYFPFERNRYFYGKLLSVGDFELEQKYMNNKRRMLNRMLYGNGVVGGLEVIAVGDKTLCLEMGLAIDFSGREIVVDAPLKTELSMIDGFDSYEDSEEDYGYMYLCIEYAEQKKEVVHNIAGGSGYATDSNEYNKYKEGYRLYLTSNEPNVDFLSKQDLYEETQTVFLGYGIQVKQSMPKFSLAGQKVPMKVVIENMGQQQSIAFTYNLKLKCLKYKEEVQCKVSFNEKLFDKSDQYELYYFLTATDVDHVEAVAVIDEESFKLSLEGKEQKAEAKGQIMTLIVKRNTVSEVIENYYNSKVEPILKNTHQIGIYLSKILLVKSGDSYSIQSIRNIPFGQYVGNQNSNTAVNQYLIQEVKQLREELFSHAKQKKQGSIKKEEKDEGLLVKEGVVDILFDGLTRKGQRYFSEEIEHGLGIGNVTVILGYVSNRNQVLYGSSEVFDDVEILGELAAKVDEIKGVFKIGLRLLQATHQRRCRVHYTAIKNKKVRNEQEYDKKIYIKPNVLKIKPKEFYYLEAVCTNMDNEGILWTVKENCGTVDQNGKYTAPNQEGIFEVIANSVAYPSVKASIFIVVKD